MLKLVISLDSYEGGKENLNDMVNVTHDFSSGPSCEEEVLVLNVGHLHFYWLGGDVRLFVHSYTHIWWEEMGL